MATDFTVSLLDQNGNEFVVPDGIILSPQRYGGMALGGFDQAEIAVFGNADGIQSILRSLAHRVYIRNRHGTVVWLGYVEEASVSIGAIQIGVSLANLANKIDVFYSTTVNGVSIDGRTGFSSDTESIARYGTKELLLTANNTNLSKATAKRNAKLTFAKSPAVTRSLSFGDNDQTAGSLRCKGFVHTLSWRYYAQNSGLEENGETGNAQQVLGQGFTASTIGFTNDGKIHDLTGRFNSFYEGKIQITGSTSNNGERRITAIDNRYAQSYTATSISFDATDDVMDTPNDGFGFVQISDYVQVAGAATGGNNAIRRCKSASADHLVVKPANITTEAAGASVTVTRGNWIQTFTGGTHEGMGASMTVTAHGVKIAQSFTLTNNVPAWTVDKIVIRCQKIGAPADNVKVELCADSSGAPGTVIESVTVAASGISTALEWLEFTFTNVNSLTYGTTYWIVISRTGSNEATNHYLIDVDESLPYTGGVLKLWTGSAWVDRSTNADLVFRVLGAWATTTQIQQIVTDVGAFFAGTDIVNTSGVNSNQYRNGETTAYDELMALLEDGTSNSRRLHAEVTQERILRVYEQPALTVDPAYLMDNSGNLTTLAGFLPEHGKLPHGQLIALSGIPPTIDALTKVSPFICERAEFDCNSGRYSKIDPLGTDDPWDMGGLNEG